jgi:hypothetical protein
MSMEPNHDEAIDKALAALRHAIPPEGMNARIAQRLAQTPAPAPGRSNLFHSSTLTGAWGRGAATGAATAMLAMGLLLLATHLLRTRSTPTQRPNLTVNKGAATPAIVPVSASLSRPADAQPATGALNSPCVRETPLSLRRTSATPIETQVRADRVAEVTAPSHPAPELPLTAEERELVHLARTADPQVLATINPETQAKLLAEEAAEFEHFFAPPPTSSAKQNNE